MDLGSSTELITLKPWSTGKQLPLGFSVFDQASSLGSVESAVKTPKQQASSDKHQATSLPQSGDTVVTTKG